MTEEIHGVAKDTDEVVKAEQRPDDFLVVLHDDVDARPDTFVNQLCRVKRWLNQATKELTLTEWLSQQFPHCIGETNWFNRRSKEPSAEVYVRHTGDVAVQLPLSEKLTWCVSLNFISCVI